MTMVSSEGKTASNIILILIAICFILGILYIRKKDALEDREKFFDYCHMYCPAVRDCSDYQAPRVRACRDNYAFHQEMEAEAREAGGLEW